MQQPIRKQIINSGLVIEPTEYILIVDANNLFKICFHADRRLNSKNENIGGVFQFLLQLKIILSKRNFTHVYCFWDGQRSGKLRYDIYPEYKANRDKNYSDYSREINDYSKKIIEYSKSKQKTIDPEKFRKKELEEKDFETQKNILHAVLEQLFIRQIMFEFVEGDDLIAHYCLNKKDNQKIYLISGDKDMTQLLSDDIAIYNPNLKKYITNKNCKDEYGIHQENVVLLKTICGDTSDNIKGIKGVGEKTLFDIIPEIKTHKITLEDVLKRVKMINEERINNKQKPLKSHENILNSITDGCQGKYIYEINEKIINLKEPMLTNEASCELEEVIDAPLDPNGRNLENLYSIFKENDIQEFLDGNRFSNFFEVFKNLMNKELSFYKKNI